ncbi:TetR/AcrR family transcriptional regulator [uncultured Roseobacter sp.]|uniref:TetR/AcrR family transcriptional regulator n=1 Tax=uncultured Roseobacter sp. TaxID=114847 RepID=UPI00262EF42E|nr:TetR/AcrR family transcriptional regulator [uncultured Roseobacter sp.]
MVLDDFEATVNTYCMDSIKSDKDGQESKSDTDRLGPDAWIDAAYAQFQEGGVSAVRIDPLAKHLNITRGSFYWHFKDRAALLRAVLTRWREEETERVIAANEAAGGDAGTRLLRLLHTCSSDDGRLEIGMRDWATQDKGAQNEIRLIDKSRIEYMTSLAEDAGVPSDVARPRCRVAYLAWLGSYSDATATSHQQRQANMDTLWHMVTAK